MTTEVLRNMIYAGVAGARRPALRRARRGPLPPGRLPGPGVGGGHHPPAARRCGSCACRPRCRTPRSWPTGSRRCGARPTAVIEERRPGRARATCTWSATAVAERLHLLPDARRRPAQPRGDAGSTPSRSRRPARPAGAARRRLYTPRRVEVVERLADEEHAAGDLLHLQPGRVRRRRRPRASTPACGSPTPEERARIRAIVEERTSTASTDDDLDVLGYDRWLAGLEAGHRRPPRRDGAAVQGGGRGVLRRRAGEGGVRHRDAGPRHQHAGPDGGDREAHRSSPASATSSSRRASTRSSPGGPGGGASTTSATPSCCGRRSCPSTRWPALASSRTFALTSAFRPDVQHGRQPGAPLRRPTRPTTCSTCRSPSTRPTATSCGSRRRLERPQRAGSTRCARRCGCDRGDVEEYRGAPASAERGRRRPSRDRPRSRTRWPGCGPGDVVDVAGGAAPGGRRCSRRRTARAGDAGAGRSPPSATRAHPRRRRLRRAARARSAASSCPTPYAPNNASVPARGRRPRCAGPGSSAGERDGGRRRRRRADRRRRAPSTRHPVADCPDLRRPPAGARARPSGLEREVDDLERQVRGPHRVAGPPVRPGARGCSRRGATSTAGRSPTAGERLGPDLPRVRPAGRRVPARRACSTASTRRRWPAWRRCFTYEHRGPSRRRRRGSRRPTLRGAVGAGSRRSPAS